jgi:ABC-type Mn2+/Zn2+ transport system permease subunit
LKRVNYYIVLIISGLGIPLFAFGIINTMVSLKYETVDPTDCISSITGQDLCLTINVLKGLILVFAIIIISLLIFRKRILGYDSNGK